MTFDPTISLGTILSAVAVILTILIASLKIVSKISKMEMKLELIWKWYAREHGMDNGHDE